MIGASTKGLTLREILFERPSAAETGRALHGSGVEGVLERRLGGVPPRLRTVAREEVIQAIVRVLDIDLVDVLAGAWTTWEGLSGPAGRSLTFLGQTELVELVDHRISSSHRPYVDVTLDDRRVGQIAVAVDVGIELRGVQAVVASGRLVTLRSGRADVEALLAVEKVEVAHASRSVELSNEVGLGDGIPLAGPRDVVELPPSPIVEWTSAM